MRTGHSWSLLFLNDEPPLLFYTSLDEGLSHHSGLRAFSENLDSESF
jgi:hypothetical protein